MKTVLIVLTALSAFGALAVEAGAKEYNVQNIGKGGLKSSCARGGGTFNDGANSYACTYENGNIRECSKRDGHCIVVTPPKRVAGEPTGPAADFGTLSTMGMGPFD